jgi:Uma2 family endonuclease
MATTPKVLTYEEWLKLPEVEGIEEIVNGEVRRMPPNKWNHARIIEELARQLRAQLNPETIYVMTSVFGLVIRREPLTTRVTDLAVFVASQLVEVDGYIHSAPELVVEVLSPANTRIERTEKLRDYESIGTPEVWVLSPEALSVEILQLDNGKLATTAILREGQLKPARFPQVAVDIAGIWPKRLGHL